MAIVNDLARDLRQRLAEKEIHMPTFEVFKNGPASSLLLKAGISIKSLNTWGEYTEAFQRVDHAKGNTLAETFMTMPASTGEKVVIQAILHAADYSRFADQMAEEDGTWGNLQFTFGEHAQAVAAAIVRRNR